MIKQASTCYGKVVCSKYCKKVQYLRNVSAYLLPKLKEGPEWIYYERNGNKNEFEKVLSDYLSIDCPYDYRAMLQKSIIRGWACWL